TRQDESPEGGGGRGAGRLPQVAALRAAAGGDAQHGEIPGRAAGKELAPSDRSLARRASEGWPSLARRANGPEDQWKKRIATWMPTGATATSWPSRRPGGPARSPSNTTRT